MIDFFYNYCPWCGAQFEVQEEVQPCQKCHRTTYHNQVACTAAILYTDTQILLTTRGIEPKKGSYDLPGGFVTLKETVDDGIKRELREELGLELKTEPELFGIFGPDEYEYQGRLVMCSTAVFLSRVDAAIKLEIQDDVYRAEWVSFKDALNKKYGFKSIEVVIKRFVSQKLSEISS